MKRLISFLRLFADRKKLMPAIPNLALALAYALHSFPIINLFGFAQQQLAGLVALQFLVIHSFPFLFIIGSLKTIRGSRKLRAVIFWGLLACYILMASAIDGIWGIFAFAGLTLTTYIGFFLRSNDLYMMNQLVVRWAVNFVAYIVISIVLNMPSSVETWVHHGMVYVFGLSYFLILGIVEWSGFYQSKWIEKLPIARNFIQAEKSAEDNPVNQA